MAEKKKLGDILKENGLINDSQLDAALTHQKTWEASWGLFSWNWVTSRNMIWQQ